MAIAQNALAGFGAGTVGLPTDVVLGTVGVLDFPFILPFLLTSDAGYEVSQDLTLPAGAVVTQASLTVAASAPQFATTVGDIATVRASSGPPTVQSDEIVLDFGVLRTVSSVDAPAAITSVSGWRGSQFDMPITSDVNSAYVEFTEAQTERLLVTLAAPADPASFAENATVTTTTPPADLELLVGGTRAWNRAGPVPEGFTQEVDVTATLQAALDGGTPGADGQIAVRVTLRARVAGTLSLSLTEPVSFLRTHTVAFGGSGTATRAFAGEGQQVVPLPLPDDASGWIVHRVLATVTATDDAPERVLPPVGPVPSTDAALVLDPDRRILVHVPAARFARFERLVGMRVAVQPEAGGVELAGALLADAERAHPDDPPLPGDPLPKGTFTPLTLDEAGEPEFVTLALPQPLKLVAGADLWFSLAATRGSAVVGLAGPGEPDPATLRRVMPNGVVRELSTAGGVPTGLLQLRVVGIAPELAPVDVIDVDLAGGGAVREPVTDPALAAGGLVSLRLDLLAVRPGLALQLTATAATTATIGPVVVVYAESPSGGSP